MYFLALLIRVFHLRLISSYVRSMCTWHSTGSSLCIQNTRTYVSFCISVYRNTRRNIFDYTFFFVPRNSSCTPAFTRYYHVLMHRFFTKHAQVFVYNNLHTVTYLLHRISKHVQAYSCMTETDVAHKLQ